MFDCGGCHTPGFATDDEGAPYREQLVAAKGKHPGDLARWIRNPEAHKPGTAMPTYAGMLSESDAEKLAAWIIAGGV
ncbi:MAG: c-type cytochrome [Thermoanaerobaculia bacterium]